MSELLGKRQTITVEQVNLWCAEPTENQVLEFKEARNQYDRKTLFEYCVAIANEGGGHLILGVADGPLIRKVVGSRAFESITGITEHIFQTVGFRVDVSEVQHPSGRVVVFAIPSRVRGTAYNLDGKYLMRSGSSLIAMSEDRLRTIFAEGQSHWGEETASAPIDAEAIVRLLDTQAFFELLGRPYPTTQEAVLDQLVAEQLVDRNPGHLFTVRRLGALLLAKRLRDFPEVSSKAPRVTVYNGADKLDVKLDQFAVPGYAVGFQSFSSSLWPNCHRTKFLRTLCVMNQSFYQMKPCVNSWRMRWCIKT